MTNTTLYTEYGSHYATIICLGVQCGMIEYDRFEHDRDKGVFRFYRDDDILIFSIPDTDIEFMEVLREKSRR